MTDKANSLETQPDRVALTLQKVVIIHPAVSEQIRRQPLRAFDSGAGNATYSVELIGSYDSLNFTTQVYCENDLTANFYVLVDPNMIRHT